MSELTDEVLKELESRAKAVEDWLAGVKERTGGIPAYDDIYVPLLDHIRDQQSKLHKRTEALELIAHLCEGHHMSAIGQLAIAGMAREALSK